MNSGNLNKKKQTNYFYSNNPMFYIFTIFIIILIISLTLLLHYQIKKKETLKTSVSTLQQQSIHEKALHQNQLKSTMSETYQNTKYQEIIKATKQSLQIKKGEYIAFEANNKLSQVSIEHLRNEIYIKITVLTEIESNHLKLKGLLYSNKLELIKSTIFHSNEEVFFLEQKSNQNIDKVIYSSKRDGFSPSAFHSICTAEIWPTFTLYETTNGSRFGGYTSVSFDGNDLYKYDETAFMFNINNKEIYQIQNKQCAVHADKQFFPSFDGDALFVDSKSGHAVLHKVKGLTDGLKKFEIEKIEVFLASASP